MNINIIIPLSFCPNCNKKIKYVYNIPVISYLFLKGRSICCHKKISLQYPLVELIVGIGTVFLFLMYNYSWDTICSLLFFIALVIIFVTDIQNYIIPDKITYPIAAFGIFSSLLNFSPFLTGITESLIGGLFAGLLLFLTSKIYFVIRKREGMGMGDVKMVAMMGFWMGLYKTVIVITISSIVGAILGVVLILIKKITWNKHIPFGSLLSLLTIFYWLIYLFNTKLY